MMGYSYDVGSGASGAVTGAMAGSTIFPGLGTATGAILGSLGGLLEGFTQKPEPEWMTPPDWIVDMAKRQKRLAVKDVRRQAGRTKKSAAGMMTSRGLSNTTAAATVGTEIDAAMNREIRNITSQLESVLAGFATPIIYEAGNDFSNLIGMMGYAAGQGGGNLDWTKNLFKRGTKPVASSFDNYGLGRADTGSRMA